MSKKNVLVLIKGLGRGGAEQIIASASPYFDRGRFDYRVAYLLPWKDALVGELERADVPAVCLDGARGTAWIGRLRRLIAQHRIDLVHAHSPASASAARALLRFGDTRFVYTEHNLWGRYHPATRWGNMVTFRRNDHVFAVSDHVRSSIRLPHALRLGWTPPVETLYHGIDPGSIDRWRRCDGIRQELGILPDAPVVGTVANFKTHKRLDILLLAAQRVRRAVPDVRVVLVGQGPLEPEMRSLSHALDLDDTVVFTGFREDAPLVASTFDVFALSSEYEGLSIALVEALALGKPAVVTDVGGLTEVVEDGEAGFVVPVDDPAALARRIVELLKDPALRSRMGAEGRRTSARFDIRRSVERMEAVYEELLA